jgi:hypothetical protein
MTPEPPADRLFLDGEHILEVARAMGERIRRRVREALGGPGGGRQARGTRPPGAPRGGESEYPDRHRGGDA